MPPAMSHRKHALQLVQSLGIARARDFKAAGIPLVYLKRLTEAGELVRLARGLYQLPAQVGQDLAHELAEAARRVPQGVVCLVSALHHHGITSQLPSAVWLMLPLNARIPQVQDLRLEIVRATNPVLKAGIEHLSVEGVQVPVYNVAKTIADCFKHRRQVGEDVAIEALRDALNQRKASVTDVLEYAAINRVTRRIEPYLRALQ